MSVSRTIVQAHVDSLWAETGPADWAAFRLVLPVFIDIDSRNDEIGAQSR